MDRVFIVSEDARLYSFLKSAPKYGDYFDDIEFVNVTSVTNIVERNVCVIIDKSDYELDVLRLFAKKMYVIICSDGGSLDIDIEEDNKVIVVNKPYNIEQLFCAIKLLLVYRDMDNEIYRNKDTEVDVRKAAETDYLTGLPNRRGMYEYFTLQVKTGTIHCMFMDIDNFKKVNDTYGHKMGDKLLIKVSHMVKEKIGGAFFARLSGDEFAVIIDGDVPNDQVVAMAEEIIDSVDEIEMGVDVSSVISFSIGIMFNQPSSDDLDDILLRCDVAMYQAKKTGKGKYIIYNDIEEQVMYKMSVDRDKYSALAAGQFKIYLQPRMNMVTSDIEGVEARINWEHPKDGLRETREFIDILEEDGFVVELEMQMFEELCKIVATWVNTPLESMVTFIRMSKKHLYNKKFVSKIKEIVTLAGLKPENFRIGFNEIESLHKVQNSIASIKKAGFEVACSKGIGDNKSALLNVNDSLADEWIIESDLVKGMCSDRTSAVVTRSIISLAKQLNIRVVSRGIEEKREMDYLTKDGCDIGVGPYFKENMKPQEFYEFALENIVIKNNSYIYSFNGNLLDQNGENEGKFVGEGCTFEWDEELGKNVLRFPGRSNMILDNTVELPENLLNAKNYTVSIAFKPDELKLWGSIFYVEFSNGFSSIMPYAWDGVVMFRVKDELYEEEWHDAIGQAISEKEWYYITVTYNSKKQESRLYVNGVLAALRGDVHLVDNPVRIVVGGDVYQDAFAGTVSNVVIHDYVISSEEAVLEYQYYVGEKR